MRIELKSSLNKGKLRVAIKFENCLRLGSQTQKSLTIFERNIDHISKSDIAIERLLQHRPIDHYF